MRAFIIFVLMLACLTVAAEPAQAAIVRMRSDLCYATPRITPPDSSGFTTPDAIPESVSLRHEFFGREASRATIASDRLVVPHVSVPAVQAMSYTCERVPDHARYVHGWVWMKLRNPAVLKEMAGAWVLLIDQTRFERLVTIVVGKNGKVEQTALSPGVMGDTTALGGMIRVPVGMAGKDVAEVYVGAEGMDDLSLMRKLSAVTSDTANWLDRVWVGLMGVFAGTILTAFAYNLLIYTGQRFNFQRWYLFWSAIALAYGASWTGILGSYVPMLEGPPSVGLNYILVACLIAAGNMFLFSVMEEGVLPLWLERISKVLAASNVAMGLLAWSRLFDASIIIDQLLNIGFALGTICGSVAIVIAITQRSRVVWFYLAGWTPVLCVFIMRVLRNFGMSEQDDLIDMLTFATLAFESCAMSLAIADRFRMLGRQRDVAEQARRMIEVENESFRRAAQTDYLTGLGNRAAFQNHLRSLCERHDDTPFQLMLIDVDYLKDINDRFGHDGGDVLLESVGKGLLQAAGEYGHVSRIGGDEFAILLPEYDEAVERVHKALEELQGTMMTHAGRYWTLSLSIGFARFPSDAGHPDILSKNADLALYQAKQTGRRRTVAFTPALRAHLDARQRFREEAVEGLARGEFVLYYQPIVDLPSGLIRSYEALLRWNHPVHGMMTPAVFGEVLNDRKVGLSVQQQVLEMALTDLRDNPAVLPRVAINCTMAQLEDARTARAFLAKIRSFGVEPDRLCIEVTEDFVLDRSITETVQALGILHDAGLTVALDDFGTGYASLIHLKHVPFDIIKIDRSFTLGLFQDDGQSEEIIRAIVGLGHGLRKQVVAEGVETDQQRQCLMEMGCQLGQGYWYARPQPLQALVPDILVKPSLRAS